MAQLEIGTGSGVVNVLLDDQSLMFIPQLERTFHVYSVEDNKLDRLCGLVIPVTVGVPVKVYGVAPYSISQEVADPFSVQLN